MKLVKLGAIDSTNDYLKNLVRQEKVENFTVVTAEQQTKGKGQRGSTWTSEPGKNLIVSILVERFIINSSSLFELNIAVSVAVRQALAFFNIPNLSIKWPNDIMSDDKKIGGILIENSFKSDNTIYSIVGIGINVNQMYFQNLPNASSIILVTGVTIEKEELLLQIIDNLKDIVRSWPLASSKIIQSYTETLFRKDVMMPFQSNDDSNFMGTIRGITATGRLNIEDKNGIFQDYDIKEIKMIF